MGTRLVKLTDQGNVVPGIHEMLHDSKYKSLFSCSGGGRGHREMVGGSSKSVDLNLSEIFRVEVC